MKRGALLVLVVAYAALGESTRGRMSMPPASASNIAPGPQSSAKVVEVTTADQTLYVDPTGSDSNACTGTLTSACATLQGALNKSPKHLFHQLTVNVAAGNYAGATISGFTIDPSVQKTTAGILLDGALANVVPTTGNATGTASAGTAGSGSTFGTLTDAASGNWTVNDAALVGKFVVITGGTGAGQVRVIVSNTATVLTVAGQWTAPTASSTYSLQSPSVVINSLAAATVMPTGGTEVQPAGLQIVDDVTGASRITVRNFSLAPGGLGAIITSAGTVELIQVSTSTAPINIGSSTSNNNIATLTTCSIVQTGIGLSSTTSTVTLANTRVSATSFDVFASKGGSITVTQSQLNGTGFFLQQGATGSLGTSRCDCSSAANSACLVAGTSPATLTATGPAHFSSAALTGNVDVTNCAFGVVASGLGIVSGSSSVVLSGNALTYGANAVHGGRIILPTATTTITGATAQMSVDTGAVTGTWASLGASFACIQSTTGTFSSVCRL